MNNTLEQLKRIEYVDYMKAFGMFFIIWGHIMLTGITNAMAYAFHIPLFFFLSGLMFKTSKYPSFSKFFVKRVKSLLIPYVIYSVITWGIWGLYSFASHADVDSYIYPLLQTIIAQGSGGFLIHNVPLWFITCLFVVEILYFFISKLDANLKVFVCILCGIVGSLMTLDNPIFNFKLLPWNIEVAFAAIPFYAIGNYIIEHHSHREVIEKVKKNRTKSIIIFLLSSVCLYVGANLNGSVSMGSNHLNNFIIFYVAALFGITAMFILCVWLSSLNKNCISKFIEWFGRNSFTSMAIHNPIKGIVVVLVAKLIAQTDSGYVSSHYYYAFIAFVVSVIATCIGIVLVNYVKKLYHKI